METKTVFVTISARLPVKCGPTRLLYHHDTSTDFEDTLADTLLDLRGSLRKMGLQKISIDADYEGKPLNTDSQLDNPQLAVVATE